VDNSVLFQMQCIISYRKVETMDRFDDDNDDDDSAGMYHSSSSDDDHDAGQQQRQQRQQQEHDNDMIIMNDEYVDIGFRSHHFLPHRHQGWKGKHSPNRTKQKNEAIYGVFYENGRNNYNNHSDDDEERTRKSAPLAPIFVPAKKTKNEFDDKIINNDDNNNNASAAVKGSDENIDKTEQKLEPPPPPPPVLPSEVDDSETLLQQAQAQQQAKLEQEQADQCFWSLLNKARENTHKRKRKRSTISSGKSDKSGETPPLVVQSPPNRSTTGPNDDDENLRNHLAHTISSDNDMGRMLPTSFGPNLTSKNPFGTATSTTVTKKDSSIAKWEQHTKGIGSKLLAKMGWKGSGGLGSENRRTRTLPTDTEGSNGDKSATISTTMSTSTSNINTTTTRPLESIGITKQPKKGISRPVQVVVRPTNLGLGFGNFKEATQLKSNRQLEAEVRGIDLTQQEYIQRRNKKQQRRINGDFTYNDEDNDDDVDDDNADPTGLARSSSAIPNTTTDLLLTNRSWKRSRQRINKLHKKNMLLQQPEIIPYQELLRRQQQQQQQSSTAGTVVIDMRGPNYTTITPPQDYDTTTTNTQQPATMTTKVQLGEELLYNLSFLLNMYENKLLSSATFAKSTQHKLASMDTDIEDLRYQIAQERLPKMERSGKRCNCWCTILDGICPDSSK
jgi:hypothetical protein